MNMHDVFGASDEIVVERLHDRLSRALVNPILSWRTMVDTPEAVYVEHYAIGGDGRERWGSASARTGR